MLYTSEVTGMSYKTVKELEEAEAKAKAEEEAKKKLSDEKRERAKEIEEAKKHLLEVRKQAREMIREADDKYNELVNKFIEDYHSYHESTCEQNGESVVTVGELLDSFFGPFIGM